MKKFLFLGLAAMMAFTSCTKDETLATAQNGAIGFDVAADKATRSNVDPSTTTESINNFEVYGWMKDFTGVVFDGEVVTKNGGAWTYANTQYWTPNKYAFAALSPAKTEGGKWTLTKADTQKEADYGIGQVAFTNDGTQDLLYWAGVSDNTNNGVEDAPVSILFNHLLSKVKFSFVNKFDNPNARIAVKDIKITNAYDAATIDLAVEDWWSTPSWVFAGDVTTTAREFGNAIHEIASDEANVDTIEMGLQHESDKEMLLFPVTAKKFNITFTVELYMGSTLADTYEHDLNITTTLEMGKAYDFKAEIDASNVAGEEDGGLKPIEFEVEVKEWDEVDEIDLYTNHKNAEVAAGETLTLTNNGIIVGTMKVAGTLDGANNVLMSEANPTDNGLVRPTGNATVKNVTIDGKGRKTVDNKGLRGIYITTGGVYTLDNVHVYGTTYAINVNTTEDVTLNVTNSTLEGWTSYGTTTTASFTKVAFENGEYANFKPYASVTLTDCTFEEGFMIDFTELNGVITFKNCTYGTTPITSVADLKVVDGDPTGKVAF